MFTFLLDSTSELPLYEQLYLYIKNEIRNHIFQPGDKLPSKRSVAAHLKVSQITVENAYNQLVAEGYLYSKPRSGYFVEDIHLLLDRPDNKEETHISTCLMSPSPKYLPSQSYRFEETSPISHTPSHTETSREVLYELKTNSVDTSIFPYATWAKLLREVLSTEGPNLLPSMPSNGILNLRMAISKHLSDYRGIIADPENIIVGSGSEFLLGIVVTLLGKDLQVGVENPGYLKTSEVYQNHHAKVTYLPLDQNGVSITEVRKHDLDALHITPSHHFPLGVVMPLKRRSELLSWASSRKNRYLIEDDYDSEFRYNGRPIPALKSIDHQDCVIYLNTFTKTLAPSLRISYMVLPNALRKRYHSLCSHYASTVSSFEQYTLAKFMMDGYFERHLGRIRKQYKARRDALIDAIEKSLLNSILTISGEDNGLHLLFYVHNGIKEQNLINAAKNHGVIIHGLSEYVVDKSTQMDTSTLVIGFSSLPKEDIPDIIHRLELAWCKTL